MRYSLILLCSMVLTGCVNYAGMHGNSQKFDASSLSQPQIYKIPPTATGSIQNKWWIKFNDAELNALIAIAIQDAPNMHAAEARIRQAQYLAKESGTFLWPSIDMNGYAQRQRFPDLGLTPPPFNGHTFNIGELGLNFNYELDFWGKNRETLRAAISMEQASEAELAEAELVLSAAVASTYFQLCNNVAQVELISEKWELDRKILQIAVDRSNHGVSYAIPVNTLLTTLQIDKQNLERYRQAEFQTRHQLAVLLGKNPLNTEIETRKFSFHEYQISLPALLPAHLLAKRPDISAAKWRTEAAAHRINVARARFFPDLNLSALFSYQKIGLNNLLSAGNQNNFVTGAIDLPIFDAGARRANLGQKYAEYDLAVNEYNQTILTALREVADQLSMLKTVKNRLVSQNTSVKAARKNYYLFQSRFHHGIADQAEVMERKNLLLQQQSDLMELQTLHLQTVVAIYKALGGQDA